MKKHHIVQIQQWSNVNSYSLDFSKEKIELIICQAYFPSIFPAAHELGYDNSQIYTGDTLHIPS